MMTVEKGTIKDFLPKVDSDRYAFIDAEIQRFVSPDAWKRLRKDDKEFLRALWVRENEYNMGIPAGDSAIGKRLAKISAFIGGER